MDSLFDHNSTAKALNTLSDIKYLLVVSMTGFSNGFKCSLLISCNCSLSYKVVYFVHFWI